MNLFQASTLLTFFISILSGFIIFLRNPRLKENFFWLLLSISISSWSLSLFEVISSTNQQIALRWQYLLDISAIFIPIFYLIFVIHFLKLESKLKQVIKISWVIGLVMIVFSLTHLFKEGVEPKFNFNFWIKTGKLYFLFPLFFSLLILITFYLLFKKHQETQNKTLKYQIKYLLLAQLFGFGGGVTNFFPQIFNVYPIGNYFIIFYIIFIGISIFKFQLFNIKIILTEIFIFCIWLFMGTKWLTTKRLDDFIADGSIFLILVIFGILLIRSVYQEVHQKEQLAELNKKLEYQYNLRGKILSIISHQVRAPLTNIREFVRFLIEGEYGQLPEKALNILKRVDRNVKEELSLINDLGDFRRLEEGHLEYQFNSFNLLEIIKDTYEIYKPLANEKNLEFKIEIDYEQLSIYGDKEKLRQVLINLVDNAIKYTDQGWVKIGLEKKDNEILITVTDTGQGINKENLETIFNEFITMEEKKKILGTGLGLYLSKKIVEAHNGKIWAESEGEGKGSIFYVKLPIKA